MVDIREALVESASDILGWPMRPLEPSSRAARPFRHSTLHDLNNTASSINTGSWRKVRDCQAPLDFGQEHIGILPISEQVHMPAFCFVHLQTGFTAPRLCRRSNHLEVGRYELESPRAGDSP